MRERLGVLHERRSAPDAALERPRRREGRLRRAAVQEADERGLLAGDEPTRGSDRDQLHVTVDTAPRPSVDRVRERPQIQLGATEGDDRPPRTERVGCENGAVENEVRNVPNEHPVLAARRLPLRRVDDDDRPAALGRNGRQLAARREAASTATTQAAPLDQVDQFRPGVRRGSVRGEVVFERGLPPAPARRLRAVAGAPPAGRPTSGPRPRCSLRLPFVPAGAADRPADRAGAAVEPEVHDEPQRRARRRGDVRLDQAPAQADDRPRVDRRRSGRPRTRRSCPTSAGPRPRAQSPRPSGAPRLARALGRRPRSRSPRRRPRPARRTTSARPGSR